VTYGLRGGERVAVYAHDQAIRYYTEVLEALHDLDDPQTEGQALELMAMQNETLLCQGSPRLTKAQ
jgi:hypothetical protein